MLHASGAMHEQSRIADRNRLISFNWDAVSASSEFNYVGVQTSKARNYDLGSVLQYALTVSKHDFLRWLGKQVHYLIIESN